MSTKLNMNSVTVGVDGRVELTDAQLISIEKQSNLPSAGGYTDWECGPIVQLNGLICEFVLTVNDNNCNYTTNTRCDNSWLCQDTKNRQCDNGSSCQNNTNATTCTNTYISGCAGSP